VGVSTPEVVQRAYALLHVKGVDVERREFSGIATTPSPDRVGDIVEPKGVQFKNPLSLLLYHDSRLPVGDVKFGKATEAGIPFTASIPDITEQGTLRDRVNEAWQSVKYGLIKGVSIGFRALDGGIEVLKTGGYRFTKTEVLELSLVAIPANSEATILSVKEFDLSPADAGGSVRPTTATAVALSRGAVSASPPKATAMTKTVQEQKAAFAQTRDDKAHQMKSLMDAAADKNVTLDGEEAERYDALDSEIKSIDAHIRRLDALESANIAKAVGVSGATGTEAAAAVRGGITNVVQVNEVLPKGIGFARAVMAKAVSRLDHRNVLEVAKEMFPSDQRLHAHLKATVPAGTTVQTVWAAPLVDQTNLASEFIEYLRPATIIGKLTQVRRVPFNVRMVEQTGGGNGYWVGEGAPKPLTSFSFAAITMPYTKVAAISVITQELARFSSPSADMLVRDGLRDALVERIDIDFIDPAEAGTANVQPASITSGLTALTSAGTSADNARTDLANIVSSFVEANLNTEGLVIIMPTTLALALSFQVNSLGQPQFPGLNMAGGMLNGIPVITSQYAANASGGGNLVIALNQRELFLADDGQVNVTASTEASLQMLDNPTNNSATGTPTTVVSMYQTDSIALRAERFINWRKRRSTAVVYMDDVNWGSIGSPA
jgi:HK97 family phage major capsid protein/HK97 family phage prohead protease